MNNDNVEMDKALNYDATDKKEENPNNITAEGIIAMIENGLSILEICAKNYRGYIYIVRVLSEYCNAHPENADILIEAFEKQFEMKHEFYGKLKEERRIKQYHKSE